MQLISKICNIKYKGERYNANVPFSLQCDKIPEALVGLVEEYVENVEKEEKQFESKRKKQRNVSTQKTQKVSKKQSNKKVEIKDENKIEDDLLDSIEL